MNGLRLNLTGGSGWTCGTGNDALGTWTLTSTYPPPGNTTNAAVTLWWNVRLSDGSVVVMDGATSLEAKAAVENAERYAPLIGRQPRRVVEVTSV